MSLVDQVLSDARSEFFLAVTNALSSFSKADETTTCAGLGDASDSNDNFEKDGRPCRYVDRRTAFEAEAYIKKVISDGNQINLFMTQDVNDLIRQLFKGNELIEFGFTSLKAMHRQHSRRVSITAERATKGEIFNIYFLRPTLYEASILKSNLLHERGDYYAVICLPDVPDVFPEVLQSVLGGDFTISRSISGSKLVRLFPCNIHMAPVDSCVLSMFLSNSFEEFYADGDPMLSWFFAKAVEYLEYRMLDGAIPRVTCLGHLSRFISEALIRGRRDFAADLIVWGAERSNASSDIPFLTDELIRSKAWIRRPPDSATANDVTLDPELFKEQKKILGLSTVLDEAIFIDRFVDMVTPMCLNFTYEGLLDNAFGVVQERVNVPPGIIDGNSGTGSAIYDQYRNNFLTDDSSSNIFNDTLVQLSSPLYKEIRWLNYADAGMYLHQRALQVQKGYERGQLNTIGEMGEFVKKFKTLQQEHSELAVHVNLMSWLSSRINGSITQQLHQLEDYILQSSPDIKVEDSKLASLTAKIFNKASDRCVDMFLDIIYSNAEIRQIYRLLILLSQTRNGIKASQLQSIKKAIVDQYGFQQLLVFHQLEKMGLITVNDVPDGMRWTRLCKKLNLLVDRDTSASDYSVIFGGYAPISLRLLQLLLLSQNVTTIRSELGLLSCPVAVLKQKNLLQSQTNGHARYKLFGMIGGVTLGEIASFMSMNQKSNQRMLLLTTNVANINSFIKVTAC